MRRRTSSRAGSRPDRVRVLGVARGDRSKQTHERTAEERERDREERERRRGQLPADPPAGPPPLPPDESPVDSAPALPSEEHPATIEPPATEEPAAFEPPAVEAPAAFELPAVEEPVAFEPPAAEEVAAEEPPAEIESAPVEYHVTEEQWVEPPLEQPVEHLPIEEPHALESVPAPPEPPRAIGLPPPPPLPAELGGPRAASAVGRARRSPLARAAAVIALVGVIAAVVVLLVVLLRPEHTKTIAAPAVVKVLIPEGKTRAQIAEIAKADHLSGDYAKAAKRSSLLNPTHYGAPHGTSDLEGFLFPATYDMTVGEPVERLVEEQLAAFRENFTESQVARARTLHVTPYELLTVASMVEREAQVPGDRAKIAAVIYNRLHEGIPLGIDATIYYAVEQQQRIATYTHELTEAQLRIDSPYNTRTHTGLPPTPISNPGDASIHAAAYPAHVSYLYYVAAADGCGEQVFSDTQSEFEANVAAYHAAVSKNGGHPPKCTHKQ